MTPNPSAVIVKEATCGCCAVHTKQVHHRNFPEVWAEAGSVSEGLAYLSNQLSRALEGTGSRWNREEIEQAITEVDEFLEALTSSETASVTLCRCGARGPDYSASSDVVILKK